MSWPSAGASCQARAVAVADVMCKRSRGATVMGGRRSWEYPANPPRRAWRSGRVATSLVLASLFFAAAALTAGAGNETVQTDDAVAVEAPSTVTADPAGTAPAEAAPVEAAPVEAAPADPGSEPDASAPAPEV